MVRPLAVALATLLLIWLASSATYGTGGFSFAGRQPDYYSLLSAGFLEGHSYMEAEVHPDRFSADPDVRRQAPFLLDAALYGRRYYLYYGVAPAVLLVVPYHLLTGGNLSINTVVLAFVLLGFYFSLRTYFWCARRYFPNLAAAAEIGNILLLAFASVTPCLLVRGNFYEVPIAGAYAAVAALVYFLVRALHPGTSSRTWLAAASLAGGLAVGCRPPAVVVLPAVAVVAVILTRRDTTRRGLGRWAAAAVGPAAAVGLLLAGYNYARFGNPLEFGFNYGMNAFFSTGKPLQSPGFVWPNAKWYFFTPPSLSPYFPYVAPINARVVPDQYYSDEAVHGQAPALLLGLVLFVGTIATGNARKYPSGLKRILLVLAWIFASEFLFMTVLGVRANRYMVDFEAPLVLFFSLVAGWLLDQPSLAGAPGRPWRLAGVAAAVGLSAFNLLISFQQFGSFAASHPRLYPELAYWGNWPSHLLAKIGLLRYGPVRFTARFLAPQAPKAEPLLAAGSPTATDVLSVVQNPGGLIELLLEHEGFGGPRTPLINVEYGRPYDVEVDMGALYPPRLHPYFDGWKQRDVEIRKTAINVRFGGREVIRTLSQAYDAPPRTVYFGRNPNGDTRTFSGQISEGRRLTAREQSAIGLEAESGIWRLRVKFPEKDFHVNFPLLASGVPGSGNLLVVEIVDGSSVRFGIDYWGIGLRTSGAIPVDLSIPHTLELFVGPLASARRWPADWRVDRDALVASARDLVLWLDGKPAWRTRLEAHLDSYDFVTVGRNQLGFSSAPTDFLGPIESLPLADTARREILARAVSGAGPSR